MPELTLRKCIQLAVDTEKHGAAFYKNLSDKFGSKPEVRDVFARLSKDELIHEAQFRKLLDLAPTENKPVAAKDQEFLEATISSNFFKAETFAGVDKIQTESEALAVALTFEKSTLLFYQAVRDSLGASDALNEIIEAEKIHITVITKVLITEAKFRGTVDYW